MDHDGKKKPRSSAPPSPTRSKLSHFFKSITIDFDRSKSLQPDGATAIEWKKPPLPPNVTTLPPSADFDLLEFERKSDENINCTVNLVRDESPERFRLSPGLAALLDTKEDDRAGVVMGIWEYVRAHGLQEDEERRGIRCDERLRAVSHLPRPPSPLFMLKNHVIQIFHQDTLFFPLIPSLLLSQSHLLPLPPVALPYTIRVDAPPHGSSHHPPTIYDLRVPLPDPLKASLSALLTSPSYPAALRTIATHDEQLALTVQRIQHSKAKHAFLEAMSKDPAGFVQRWMSSQKRDLEVVLGESGRGGEGGDVEGGVWKGEGERAGEVRESVGLWLARGQR